MHTYLFTGGQAERFLYAVNVYVYMYVRICAFIIFMYAINLVISSINVGFI